MRRRLRWGWIAGTLGSLAVAALAGTLMLGRTEAVAAQPGPPRVLCNSATDWQLFWPRVPGAGPLPVIVTFDAVAGQVVDFQLNVRGPLAFNDFVGAFLYSPSGANLFPDLEDRYQLRESGTYTIAVQGFPDVMFVDNYFVPPGTVMPFTLWLRCSAPPTPPPAPAPAIPTIPPPPTPTPEAQGEG